MPANWYKNGSCRFGADVGTDGHPCQQISLECGEIGRQANGAVMLTMGKTVSSFQLCTGSCKSEHIGCMDAHHFLSSWSLHNHATPACRQPLILGVHK